MNELLLPIGRVDLIGQFLLLLNLRGPEGYAQFEAFAFCFM